MLSKGQRTRQHIIASAAPIFNRKGFAGASMADILAATGLEKGGVYRHFTSKNELACAAFDYAVTILESRRSAAQAGKSTAIARLHASINAVAQSVYTPPLPGGCPILNTAIEADDTHSELRARAAAALRDWQRRIGELVEDGVATGELRADADAAVAASLITAALEGAVMTTALLQDRAQMDRVAVQLRTFVDSLRADCRSENAVQR